MTGMTMERGVNLQPTELSTLQWARSMLPDAQSPLPGAARAHSTGAGRSPAAKTPPPVGLPY